MNLRNQAYSGFMLLELIISLTILAGIVSCFALYQWNTIQAYHELKERIYAVNVASTVAEKIDHYNLVSQQKIYKKEKYTVTLSVLSIPEPEFQNNILTVLEQELLLVLITVSWISLFGRQHSCSAITCVEKGA